METLNDGGRQRQQEFLVLFDESKEELRSYVGALVLNVVDADDVFQELCLTLWKKFGDFEQGTSFVAWARVIAFNAARVYWRKKASKSVAEQIPKALQALNRAYQGQSEFLELRRRLLDECIANLSKQERGFVTKIYQSGESVAQLARKAGTSEGTLYSRLSRIRQRLKKCIGRRTDG
ncbi:RNA polymerase sigma factor CarQ [Calycomorphotria hydatis]|uniref:RNA polymerase sigma factor CarQ n=2 Tax=Calycomorphotria hydatis TaxID=2528027 RepID=A0A517T367_9PLAN|nr:RNA polymerase sigma factor CarQ [Calycomorphotria hydatis]